MSLRDQSPWPALTRSIIFWRLAKEVGWPLTVVVFEGGMDTPLGLLQELHSRLALSHIAISMPEEGEGGTKEPHVMLPHMHVCCQKQLLVSKPHHQTLLEQLFLWEMSRVCGVLGAADEKTHPQLLRPKKECKKKCSKGKASRVRSDDKSSHKSKKSKKDKAEKGDKHITEREKHADHHPSLPVQLLLKNRLQILCIVVNVLLGPILLTRNQRNLTKSHTRSPSPSRRHASRYRGIQRHVMIHWSAGYASRDTGVYCLPINFLFFTANVSLCFLIKFALNHG